MSGKDAEEQSRRRAAECTIEQIGRNSALRFFTRESRFIHVGAESRVPANEALLSHDLQLFQHGCVDSWPRGGEVLLNLPDRAGPLIPEHMQDVEFCICRKARACRRFASRHGATTGGGASA